MKSYSKYQYALFRIIFGTYLSVHFAQLIPWATEIWSRDGVLADPSLNFTYGIFPNLLYVLDSPAAATGFVGVLLIASICFTLGIFRQAMSLLLWYGWACLFHRNNLIANPGLPMVGWLLLANALIPSGEGWSLRKAKDNDTSWQMPKPLYWGAWVIVGISYTLSGIDKATAPSWINGSAMSHLLVNPLARDYVGTDLLASLPSIVLQVMTWSTLLLEIAFGCLCLFKRTRALAWLAIMGMHLGILTVIDFADLTLGVIMIHLFTLDPSWFRKKAKSENQYIVYFDGVCGMCNTAVDFLMAIDSDRLLRFSPLQGESARANLSDALCENLDTIVYFREGKTYTHSTAVLKMMRDLGGIWFFPSIALLIPAAVRNPAYRFFARNRYKWFGKKEACRLPTPEERSLFL